MHFFDESFWLAVSFFIFLYFAYRPVKKAILSSLDTKIEEVKLLVSEAENLKKAAAELLIKTESEMKGLDKLREQILSDAKSDASKLAGDREKEMQFLLEQKKNDALNSINQQQVQAYNNIKQNFLQLTQKLVKEYLKETDNNDSRDAEIAKNFMQHGKEL